MQSKLMNRVVSTEYLVAAILVAVFYVSVGNFAWYWLPILFVVFDLSAVGYAFNKKIGALGYGLKHTKGFEHTHLGPIGKAKKKK